MQAAREPTHPHHSHPGARGAGSIDRNRKCWSTTGRSASCGSTPRPSTRPPISRTTPRAEIYGRLAELLPATRCRRSEGRGEGRRGGGRSGRRGPGCRGRRRDGDGRGRTVGRRASSKPPWRTTSSGPSCPRRSPVDVPEDLEVLVAENQMLYPGVDVDRIAVRSYPHGSLAAHALGYVGRITQEDLDTDAVIHSDKPYAATDEIGRTGVEASYEPWLRGQPGVRVLEVDADNNVVRQVRYRAPDAGHGCDADPRHPGADPAGDPAGGHGRGQCLARRRRGGRGPPERRHHRHGQLPDLQPPGLHDGISDEEYADADRRGERQPAAATRRSPGSTPRGRRSSRSPPSPGSGRA